MIRKLSIALILIISIASFAQNSSGETPGHIFCAQKKQSMEKLPERVTGTEDIRHSFDVLNYKLNLDLYSNFISPYPKSFNGTAEITLRADSAISSVALNAVNTSLQINSVAGAGTSFTHVNNLLVIQLDRTYNPGEQLQVNIAYQHKNVTDNAFYVSNGFVFTDAEPEGARKWFPCYDRPSDKATLNLTARVPATVKLGSNGRLADSVKTGDTIYYNWISRDPIATYLMVISAKVNYGLEILYWNNPNNPGNPTPIRLYYNAGENISQSIKTKIVQLFDVFSAKFGEHPFEKNGYATLNNQFAWGGMENQTLTSLCPGCWSEYLLVHEFAHQWFGDMVSPNTWADIFLNEGFATFSEALWAEAMYGASSYRNNIQSEANYYLNNNPGWAISNPDWAINTPNTNTLFNTAITYSKGACVLFMLRYVMGDQPFFTGLKNYAEDPAIKYKSASIIDFRMKMEQASGKDLGWFFDQWIYQPNHPVYSNYYYIQGGGNFWEVVFNARQTQTNTGFFKMPVQLRITFTNSTDTTVTLTNDANNQTFSLYFYNRQPLSVTFDPDNNIILKQASTNQITPVELTSFTAVPYGKMVSLNWTTASETNNKGFFIEKKALTGSAAGNWQEIAFIEGRGTASGIKNYSYTDVVKGFGKFAYRLKQTDYDGTYEYSQEAETEAGEIPESVTLYPNYPNPFNPETKIRFELPQAAFITLQVYNFAGELVDEITRGNFEAGEYEFTYKAEKLSSGTYLCVLNDGQKITKMKMIYLK
ncbi:MAG: T9SS type A sorting domain-containing protein [Ignavibacteriaceae bacterium]|nr:T9SS type A sorting domain-containing protein [Ignavibacteriaceae bacterium]